MAKEKKIIKYEGDCTVFVWKHPQNVFDTDTQLIVNETQEALFVADGKTLDLFGPGKYTLEAERIPKIKQFFNKLFGKKLPVTEFVCDVYFISKTEQMAIKWGTDSKIQFVDPVYGFPLSIGACGEMSVKVKSSCVLMDRLVGTASSFTQQELTRCFRAFLMTKVKTYIAKSIKTEKISVFELDENLQHFSDVIKGLLKKDFEDYGLYLEQFFITTIAKPDGDYQYEKFKDLHFRQYASVAEAQLRQRVSVIDAQTDAQKMIIESQALAQKRRQEGYTYQQERGFDVADKLAGKDSVGQFADIGIGLGAMQGVSDAMTDMLNKGLRNMSDSEDIKEDKTTCSKCGTELPAGAKFCFNCGENIEGRGKDKIKCPHCGQIVANGKFCQECGNKL